jgi:hypothetical protein
VLFRTLTSGTGRSKTRSDGERRHLGERVERLAFSLGDSLVVRPDLSDFCFKRQLRTSGVEHSAIGPPMIGMDPDVDPLVQRDVRRWRGGGRLGKPPVCSKQRREKKASHPPEILK